MSNVIELEKQRAKQNKPDEWEAPIPFDHIDYPPCPLDAFPSVLRHFIASQSECIDIDPIAVMLPVLGTVATCARNTTKMKISKFEVSLNLYTCIVAASSERKTPAMRHATAPLQSWQKKRRKDDKPKIDKRNEEIKITEKKIEEARRNAAKYGKNSVEAEEEALKLAENMPKAIAYRTYTVVNVTSEKLEVLLEENDGVIAIVTEEGGQVFDIAGGRYNKNNSTDMDTLLLGYDGGLISTERMTRRGAHVEDSALSILLAIQPVVLNRFVDVPEFKERGLIARFLFGVTASRVGFRINNDRVPDEDANMRYETLCHTMLEWFDTAATESPRMLSLEGEALVAWNEHYHHVEVQQRVGGQFEFIREWAGKQSTRTLKLIALFHIIDHLQENRDPFIELIAVDTVERAIRVSDYLCAHALIAHRLMGCDRTLSDAQYLVDWFVKYPVSEIRHRDIHKELRGRFHTSEQLRRAIDRLVELGYVRIREEGGHDGKPGRPRSPTYEINPLIYAQNSPKQQTPTAETSFVNIVNSVQGIDASDPRRGSL